MPDLLSDMLAPLRLNGVFHSRWRARAPWGIAGEREDCAVLHYVHEGQCSIDLPELDRPLMLVEGDLAVFPRGSAHRLADRAGRSTVPLDTVLPDRARGNVGTVEIGGTGPLTVVLCGGLHYDALAADPLYGSLPPVLVLPRDVLATQPLLANTLNRLAAEWDDDQPGASLVALRAFELTFVLALRVAVNALSQDQPILRALRHPALSKALHAVHHRFAEPWTVQSLASEAGLSRSAFAEVFRDLVGEPPMRHLTARRMQEGARLLTETDLPHQRIAERVGYQSMVGFHLAFRSWSGQPPGEYRREARQISPRSRSEALDC